MKEILNIIGLEKDPSDILLIDLIRIDLIKYEKKLNDIIAHATGELVLENMIKKIKEFWMEEEFQLSNY